MSKSGQQKWETFPLDCYRLLSTIRRFRALWLVRERTRHSSAICGTFWIYITSSHTGFTILLHLNLLCAGLYDHVGVRKQEHLECGTPQPSVIPGVIFKILCLEIHDCKTNMSFHSLKWVRLINWFILYSVTNCDYLLKLKKSTIAF